MDRLRIGNLVPFDLQTIQQNETLGLHGYNGWSPHNPRRYNGWLPRSPAIHERFITVILEKARNLLDNNAQHVPSVETFKKAIESEPYLLELFDKTFIQAAQGNQITSFKLLLYVFDVIVVAPPAVMNVPGEPSEPIGVPIYVFMDLLINTAAGYTLFTSDGFNKAIRPFLDSWGQYLRSPESNSTLTDHPDGWFGEEGIGLLQADERGTFNQTYVTPDPNAINRGYESWDAFFTRDYQHRARPVDLTPLPGKVIYNACESTVERYESSVRLHDTFWLKGMAYSLYDMLGGDEETAKKFVGGTVYQAFLSPEDYHQWRAPVAGKIIQAYVIPGTYYAALPDDGDHGDMHGALVRSQPWLTVAATRAIITIQGPDPIGLVCFIGVGMVEVSTCDIRVKPGDHVEPGDQLGMFHFGGSSHAVIFGKHINVAFRNQVKPGVHIHVNKIIADVTPALHPSDH
ncbi:phosphatidylserine decarboxylase family protein [Ceratobasidium sp. AG-Ba]|nr:phosphatidylserine decarboxylase family protein [Ceratobasidium sp. AG-Ba]QRV98652.1 phosphatidylserine decarboxylase family protein [Ceratobasidium sp. AG-Ba]